MQIASQHDAAVMTHQPNSTLQINQWQKRNALIMRRYETFIRGTSFAQLVTFPESLADRPKGGVGVVHIHAFLALEQ